jgi:hypothetical protein
VRVGRSSFGEFLGDEAEGALEQAIVGVPLAYGLAMLIFRLQHAQPPGQAVAFFILGVGLLATFPRSWSLTQRVASAPASVALASGVLCLIWSARALIPNEHTWRVLSSSEVTEHLVVSLAVGAASAAVWGATCFARWARRSRAGA